MRDFPPPGIPASDPNRIEPPTRDETTIPQTIVDGRYRIERVVGEGAFGRVYLAFDTRLKNYVAVKELLSARDTSDRAMYDRYLERFRREARAVFALQHPNVVTVYEMHEDSAGNYYLVMEYVDGLSLRDLLTQVGALPVERAVSIALDLARALEAIDERSIVHRDFKPANIMINRRGVAKLADFGVALIPSETMVRPEGVGHPGAPAYMSPEQETGSGPVDGRSDLYSLGLVFYEMLVGRRYRDVGQPVQVMRPDLSQQLVSIITKLLQPQAAWRYQRASEVVYDLEQLSTAPAQQVQVFPPPPPPLPPPQPPQPAKRWRGPVFGLAGVAVALVVVIIAVQVWPRPTPTPTVTPARATTAVATATTTQATPTTASTVTAVPATATTTQATATSTARPSTSTPVSTSTPPRPTTVPTSPPVARVPLGSAPVGWKTYSGTPRAPFAIYYPPDWTVDESSLTKDGSVEFQAPNGGPIVSISTNPTRTTTSIDTLRDNQAKSLAQICAKSGIESTDRVTLSGTVIFDDLLEVCDPPKQGQQIVWIIGAGLNNGYAWYFDGLSIRRDFNKNTCGCPAGNYETFFVPMLNSLRIYADPVG